MHIYHIVRVVASPLPSLVNTYVVLTCLSDFRVNTDQHVIHDTTL